MLIIQGRATGNHAVRNGWMPSQDPCYHVECVTTCGETLAGADDASIVSAVINMGKGLHMMVVAEGVETVEQLEFLVDHGWPQGRGFLFSAPPSAVQLCAYLHGRAAA